MKNTYKFLGIIAAASAMSLVSCQKQEFQPNPEGTTITVNATVEDPIVTKTYVEELEDAYAINWSESELNMQAFVWNESGYNKAESNEFTSNPDGTGTFNVTVPSGEWTNIAGIYPSSAVEETNGDTQTRMRTELPTIQNPSATSYDPAAYILIARPTALPESLEGFTWEAYYYRATALNKFMVTNLENGGNIVSVKITFPEGEKVSGYKRVNLTTAEVIEYSANNPNYVDLNYKSAPLAVNGEGSYDLWFTTWTVNVPMESTGFTVEVTTEEYKYTKTFIPKQDGFVLEENAVNIVPVNMSGAEVEAIDPAEDLSGDYLIVSKKENNGSWVYMSEIYTNNKYFTRGETNIPASREFSSLTTADFQDIDNIEKYVWTISKSSNGYIISNSRINDEGTKYLEPDDSENQAHCSDNEVSVYIEAGENGTVKIQANSSINRWLQYNGNKGQERFACYESTQNEIYLLPWVESTEPTLIVSETSKTVSADATEVLFEYIARNLTGDVTATVASDEAQIISGTPVVDAAASTVTVTLNPNTDEVEKTATITLSADGVEPITLTVNQKAFVPESTTIKATVAEFLAAEVNDNVWYELTGTITDLYNTEYGNFHLVDETGTVRVYGLTAEKVSSNDKSFSSLGLKEGDIVTLIGTRTEYNNEAQVGGPAYYVSHVVAPYCNVSPSTIPVAADATSATFKVDANVEWNIASNNPAFTISPDSGSEAAEITVSFPANESDEEVTAVLTISSELGDKTVTISQASASASTVVLLNEDFTGLSGDNTSSSGANSSWSGNDNFPTVTSAYQAGDAVKLGTGSNVGSIESKPLTVPAGTTLTVAFDVKGWTKVEGDIEVTFNGETQTVSYSAVMSGSFESKSVSFVVNSETSSTVKFATTAKRAYLDNIVISYTK